MILAYIESITGDVGLLIFMIIMFGLAACIIDDRNHRGRKP